MLRREPTTIKLLPEDVKEYYREETFNTINGTNSQQRENLNSDSLGSSGSGAPERSVKERIMGAMSSSAVPSSHSHDEMNEGDEEDQR